MTIGNNHVVIKVIHPTCKEVTKLSDSCCSPAQTNPKGGSCCCCGPFIRRFISKKEELEYLENYKDQLKKELAGLEERIKEMTGK